MTRNGELRRLIRLYSYRDTAGAKTLDRALPAPSTRIRYGDPDPKEERACWNWNTCMLIPEHLSILGTRANGGSAGSIALMGS